MTPSELAELLEANSTTALRLYLAGGVTVNIDDPRRVVIRGSLLRVNCGADGTLNAARRSKVVSIHSIAMIEPRVPITLGSLSPEGGPP